MNISKESWHYRFVKRTHDTWFKNYDDLDVETYWRRHYGWNLCPYLRAVLIWSPLAWTFGILYWIFVKPFRIAGSWLSWQIYWNIGKLFYEIEGLQFRRDKRGRKIRKNAKPAPPISEKKDNGPGLLSLIGDWLEARHDQICPVVKFVDPNVLPISQAEQEALQNKFP